MSDITELGHWAVNWTAAIIAVVLVLSLAMGLGGCGGGDDDDGVDQATPRVDCIAHPEQCK